MGDTKAEQFQERQLAIEGWPVKLTSYRVGDKYVCQADNVSPGACIARVWASTQEEAETEAISKAQQHLRKTRRYPI
jgi:hypothetical protein